MIWDLLITIGSLALFVWFVIIEPLLRRLRSLRPSLPPPRYAPLRERNERPDDSGEEALIKMLRRQYEPVPSGTDTAQYGVVRGGTDDTDAENHHDPRYAQVLEMVREGYSGNQIANHLGGGRAAILALVKRAREEVGR